MVGIFSTETADGFVEIVSSTLRQNAMYCGDDAPMEFVEKHALHNYAQIGGIVPLQVFRGATLVGVVREGIFSPTIDTAVVNISLAAD